MIPTTSRLVALCPALRATFLDVGYTSDQLSASLGPSGTAAFARSDPAGTRRASRNIGPAGTLLRFFVLGDPLSVEQFRALLPEIRIQDAVEAGLIDYVSADQSRVRSQLDLRPLDLGAGSQWVFSDCDGSMVRKDTRSDHVLGVGPASLSLLRITPTSQVSSVLDLGTGCGVQLLPATRAARTVVGTDITPRCLDFAAATLAINQIEAELREGPWWQPVAGQRFERIVANPPFVIGPEKMGHSYRESNLVLDGASRMVIEQAVDHLTLGGIAVILASWIETEDASWSARIASWIPSESVEAWVLRRDTSDPEHYVWTWLTDEGKDPRDDEYARAAEEWLDYFAEQNVTGVGFGYVYLRRIDGPSLVLCEDLNHPFEAGLGEEAESYFTRCAWLREAAARVGSLDSLLDSTIFTLAPDVHLHRSSTLADDSQLLVLERTTGARWRHEIDEGTARLVQGFTSAALPLEDLVLLAAYAEGADPEDFIESARSVVRDLLNHGFIRPVELMPTSQALEPKS